MITREEIYEDIRQMFGCIPTFVTHVPDETLEHDWSVMKTLELDEADLPLKERQLVGLGVASILQCPYCIYFHREAARFFGATDEELAETVRLAIDTAGWGIVMAASRLDRARFKREIREVLTTARRLEEARLKAA